jgi:hypothetical protein
MQPGPTAKRAFQSTEELEKIKNIWSPILWPRLLNFRDRTKHTDRGAMEFFCLRSIFDWILEAYVSSEHLITLSMFTKESRGLNWCLTALATLGNQAGVGRNDNSVRAIKSTSRNRSWLEGGPRGNYCPLLRTACLIDAPKLLNAHLVLTGGVKESHTWEVSLKFLIF